MLFDPPTLTGGELPPSFRRYSEVFHTIEVLVSD